MPSDYSETGHLDLQYSGETGPFFWLTLKTGLLTLITLGIYRFWQKTRMRKYIWSSVSADGDTFEYTGTGLEKFLGFLVAIVFLAIYLGFIQIILFYLGLSIMVDPETASQSQIIGQVVAIYVSFFAVLPFILFAVYRARRYKMARTRFRGIRLGMEKGAWGYVLRALGYGVLAVFSLGILTPLMTFRLEKYMTDRSYYGTTELRQGGKWTGLYPAMKHVFIALAILIVSGLLLSSGVGGMMILGGIGLFAGYIWIIVGWVFYAVRSFGYLMSHKVLGEDVRFDAQPRTGEVIKTYILGGLLLGILSSVVFGIAFALAMPFMIGMDDPFAPGGGSLEQGASMARMVGAGIVIAVGYLIGIVVMQALSMILITQPILAHYIKTIKVLNPEGLSLVTQREALTGIDADGFADALDIGGAI